MMLRIEVLGDPVPFSHKSTRTGIRYTEKKQRNAMAHLRMAAQLAMRDERREILDCPVRLSVYCDMRIPRSWSNKKREQAANGTHLPVGRPDLTNCLKLVEDSLNGVVWTDDSLVVEQHCKKRYGLVPKITVIVQMA